MENVAPGAAGAEAAAEAAAAEAAEREEEWSPAAAGSGKEGRSKPLPPRHPDAAVLLAARARRASRAAEEAARVLAAAAALEQECSFRPQRQQAVEQKEKTTSSIFHPPSAGCPLLASEVVPGCALHLQRAAKARETAEEERRRAEVVFVEKPRARYVATKPEPFSFSECRDFEGRHARAFAEEEAKCPFRPETRAAEDARLLRELLA